MTNLLIAQLINERIGERPVPFESVRALALEIYQDLGGPGDDEDFEDIYAILLATLPLIESGGGSRIDDRNVSTGTTWSSSKITNVLEDYATIENVNASLALKADAADLSNYATWNVVETSLGLKQDTLIAGDNITILNNVISATGGGSGAAIDDNHISENTTWSSSKINTVLGDYATWNGVETSLGLKADKSELTDYATWNVVETSLGLKQDTLTAGSNITILNNVISAAGTDLSNYYTKTEVDTALAGKADDSDLADYATWNVVETSLGLKQDTLTAGTNITISNNIISAAGADLTNYYTKTEVDTALSGKADTTDLADYATWNVVETSLGLKANTSYVDGNFCKLVILTQAQYTALQVKDPSTLYIISDAQ